MQYALAIAALAASVIAQADNDIFFRSPDEKSSCPSTFSEPPVTPSTGKDAGKALPVAFTFVAYALDDPRVDQVVSASSVYCGGLVLTLTDGRLVDQSGFTLDVVDNHQIQFDSLNGPQDTAIYTNGWAVCDDHKVSLGKQTEFWNCTNDATSTKEAFGNIYDESIADYCKKIYLVTQPCLDAENKGTRGQNDATGKQIYLSGADPSDSSSSSSSSSSSTSSSSSSSTSTTSTISSSSSKSSPSSSSHENLMTMITESLAVVEPTTTSAPVVAPTSISNTTVAPTGSGAGSPTGPGPTSAPSPFTGAGSIVAACQAFVVLVAGAAAFALF